MNTEKNIKIGWAMTGILFAIAIGLVCTQRSRVATLERKVVLLQDDTRGLHSDIENLQNISNATPTPGPISCAEIGSKYTNTEWGFEIACPSGWTLEEQEATEVNGPIKPGDLTGVSLKMGSQRMHIKRDGGMGLDMNTKYEHPSYTIDGVKASVSEDNSGTGFFQYIVVLKNGHSFDFRVSSSSESKTATDALLATFKFL